MSDAEPVHVLPVLPLKNNVLFPHLALPLVVGRAASVAAVEAAVSTEDKTLVIVSQKDPAVEQVTYSDLFPIGTQAVIKKMDRIGHVLHIIVHGVRRVQMLGADRQTGHLAARVRPLAQPTDRDTETEALHRAVLDLAGKVMAMHSPQAQAGLTQMVAQVKDPLHQVYLLSSILTLDLDKEQALLAATSCADGLQRMHEYLTHEVQVLELRQKIATEAQSEMNRAQREYILRQQLRAIQDELGEKSPEQADMDELRKKLEKAEMPREALAEAERALKRLERLPIAAPDYQLTRTHVELIAELPWAKTTDDMLDLDRARQVLDEDHYGLHDVKQRILEHLAVLKLNPDANAPILCFVGPPGVGKTSLGQSIARALGRAFARMSLGGLHDEAELRGHRRTYIGAMPGRILQAIRRAGVRNPLFMLDEVDKLGRDFRGDPAAALLEILDPAQNFEFRDNYLDLPFDLSKVFFITTANALDTVPQPLLDRMEVLRIAGYSDEEKTHIARRYLIPRRRTEAGLQPDHLAVTDTSLHRVIRRYTREAGVRELERTLGRVCRKVAVRFAEGETRPVTVDPDDLTELLGPERFFAEAPRAASSPGVAAGLAWTPAGGEVLHVEAVLLHEGRDFTLTGQLGDVMKESAQAAMSYVAAHSAQLDIDTSLFRSGVHIHVPAGATPKDGPSAGVTMATALASLLTDRAVRGDLAMTGEITLSGRVLPVGGVKEKVLAAHRAGIRHVILPRQNDKDLVDVPDHVRGELVFTFAERIEDVLAVAIPELAQRLGVATDMWEAGFSV